MYVFVFLCFDKAYTVTIQKEQHQKYWQAFKYMISIMSKVKKKSEFWFCKQFLVDQL